MKTKRLSCSLGAILTLLLTLAAMPASAQWQNAGFETGDLTGWNSAGSASVQTNASIGVRPFRGTDEGMISTSGGVSASTLESAVGLASGSLAAVGNGAPVSASALYQTVTLQASHSVWIRWDMLTNQVFNDGSTTLAPDPANNDFAVAFVTTSSGQQLVKLADVFDGYSSNAGAPGGFFTNFSPIPGTFAFRSGNGYLHHRFLFQAPADGTYTIGMAIVHASTGIDNGLSSALLMDRGGDNEADSGDSGSGFTLSLDLQSVYGGQGCRGTITLPGNAPAGSTYTITSDNPGLVICPASPLAIGGSSSSRFLLSTGPVSTPTTVNVFGNYGGSQQVVPLILYPAISGKIVLLPQPVHGGQSTQGAVVLLGASYYNATVPLSSDNPAIIVPASITINIGTGTTYFPVSTTGVDVTTTATIGATYTSPDGPKTVTTTMTVSPAVAALLQMTPSSVNGGLTIVGSLYSGGNIFLSGVAGPSGAVVSLSSNNPGVTVPASVTVASGSNRAYFSIGTSGVDSSTTVQISASTGGGTATANLTVNPAPLANFVLSSYSVHGGTSVTGVVALNGVSGPSGTVVFLSSNDGQATLPASVTIPAGAKKATFTITTSAAASATTVQLHANVGAVTRVQNLTINP